VKTALFFLSALLPACCFAQSPCETSAPIPFEDHGKWGYISPDGIIISPHFDYAGPFTGDGAIACVANQCGLLGKAGSFIAPTWDRQSSPSVDAFSEGLGVVAENGAWGYVDRQRKVAIPLRFNYAGQFDHGIARVVLKDKAFFIDKTGTRATPEFDGAFDFREDLAAVEVGKNVGYIRRDGSFALPPIHQSASGIDFSEGLAAVRINGKVGFMDKTGSVVIKPAYDDVYAFSDGLAPVELGEKWGYVDRSGNVVIPIQYDIAHMFSESVASVERLGKWEFIDRSGKPAIPATFDAAMPFCGGLAAVENFRELGKTSGHGRAELYRGKHGLVDHTGNYVWRESEEQTWRSPYRN
jgi:hypothetical protein